MKTLLSGLRRRFFIFSVETLGLEVRCNPACKYIAPRDRKYEFTDCVGSQTELRGFPETHGDTAEVPGAYSTPSRRRDDCSASPPVQNSDRAQVTIFEVLFAAAQRGLPGADRY